MLTNSFIVLKEEVGEIARDQGLCQTSSRQSTQSLTGAPAGAVMTR